MNWSQVRRDLWIGAQKPLWHPIWYLRSRAIDDGLRGGRRGWQAVGVAVWGLWLAQRVLARPSEVAYRTELRPGDSLVVDVRPPPSGKRGGRRSRS